MSRNSLFCGGIENLHECSGGVAAKIAAELVQLVQHDHRVGDLGAAHGLNDAPGHGTNIGAPVAPQFRLVVQTTKAQALEAPAHGAGDGLPEGGFADAGRANETQDRRFRSRVQLHDRQRLENAFFDVLEPVVIFVENGLGVGEVEIVVGAGMPRQLCDQFQITAGHLIIGSVRRHAAKALQFPVHFFLHRVRQFGIHQLLPQLADVLVLVALAEGLFDGLLLLPQHVFALLLFDVVAGLFGNLPAQLGDAEFVRQDAVDVLHQFQRALAGQRLLLQLQIDVGEGRDAIHLDHRVAQMPHQLLVDLLAVVAVVKRCDALRQLAIDPQQRLNLRVLGPGFGKLQFQQMLVLGGEVGTLVIVLDHLRGGQLDPPLALDDNLCTLLLFLDPRDGNDASHGIEVCQARLRQPRGPAGRRR